MKIKSRYLVLIFATFVLTGLQAQSRTCITREDQLHTSPVISGVVKKLGGVKNLEGQWRLGGFAGAVKKVVLSFQSEGDGLKGHVAGLDGVVVNTWTPITVCETSRTDTVMILIYGQKDYLFMTPISSRAMNVAQVSNGKAGSYYTFNKN